MDITFPIRVKAEARPQILSAGLALLPRSQLPPSPAVLPAEPPCLVLHPSPNEL